MSDAMPNMYFFMGKTHVHHLNYGIFLLGAVCGYSVFQRPTGRRAEMTALIYGVAMGLTFDEFGMWLHLGGSYWQRVSVDATIVVLGAVRLDRVWALDPTFREETFLVVPGAGGGADRFFGGDLYGGRADRGYDGGYAAGPGIGVFAVRAMN